MHHSSAWYLDIWCHNLPHLAADAVASAEVLDLKAEGVDFKMVVAELDCGYGTFARIKPQLPILLYCAGAA